MARYFIRSTKKSTVSISDNKDRPRETKLIQRATLHAIAGDVENITRVRGFVNTRKNFIETTYFDKLNVRWYRSITLFNEPIKTANVGPSHTANQWHALNNPQRYLKARSPQMTFISSPLHLPSPQHNNLHQSNALLFRAG